MARFVTFGGQTQFKPGGITRINANALTPIGLSATGIIHLLGEADGGAPGSEEIAIIDDPALAKEIFRSGPLADAIRVAFNPSGDDRIPGGAFRVIAYKTNQGTQSSLKLRGDEVVHSAAATSGTTTVITNTLATLQVNGFVGDWVFVGTEYRKIVSNTATTITVSPPFPTAVGTSTYTIVASQLTLTSRDYGAHTTQISVEVEPGSDAHTVVATISLGETVEQSPELGGDAVLELRYVGGAMVAGSEGPVTAATTSTVSINVTSTPTLNQYASMLLELPGGERRLITGNTAADPSVVTLTAGYELTSAEAAALVGQTVRVINVTTATASVVGSLGKATGLTTAVLPVADNLSITFTAGQTLQQLVDYINGSTNFEASVPDGVNAQTFLVKDFDYGTRATTVDVRFDHAISYDDKGTFRADLYELISWINEFSELVTASRYFYGSELPVVTGGVSSTLRDVPLYLAGGTRGASTNTDWQDGFDALMEQRGNHIVPLCAYDLSYDGYGSTATLASIAAMLLEHVKVARTTGKNEMGGYLGLDSDKDGIIAQAAALNDGDIQLIPQKMSFLNVAGELTEMPEWASAVAAAGMRSGANEVGEPLTFKFISTTTLSNDSSWSPSSRTDVNQLIAAGVMFAEKISRGIRWVRDITTHIKDDNIAFSDGNTREAVRFIAYDLRQSLEDKFTGLKATPATAASIREFAAAKMAEYLTNNIIVESLDPETGTKIIPGFRNLRVFINGNTATVRIEIFPVTGIVFILNDIYLQLPRLAA